MQRVVQIIDGFAEFVVAPVLNRVFVGQRGIQLGLFEALVDAFKRVNQVENHVDEHDRAGDDADNQHQPQNPEQKGGELVIDGGTTAQ